MKYPKEIRKYCPFCRTYTLHKVKIVKPSKRRGALKAGQRRYERKVAGYTGSVKPTMKKSSGGYKGRYGSKTSTKVSLLLTCTVCKKAWNLSGWRAKSIELK